MQSLHIHQDMRPTKLSYSRIMKIVLRISIAAAVVAVGLSALSGTGIKEVGWALWVNNFLENPGVEMVGVFFGFFFTISVLEANAQRNQWEIHELLFRIGNNQNILHDQLNQLSEQIEQLNNRPD